MALKDILLAPGPSQVPDRVRLKLAEPAWYHRSQKFKKLYADIKERLQKTFETKSDCMVFAGSGTVALEAGLVNIAAPGRKLVVVSGGKWGERLVKITEAFKLDTHVLKIEYGKSPTPEQVAEAAKDPKVIGVVIHLCETSTGAKYDVKAIGAAVKKVNAEALFVVDGISGAVAMECPLDAWGVDMFMAGSQKGLMLPPGLAVLTVSPKAWAVVDSFKAPVYYSSLREAKKPFAEHDTPYTPANTLMAALNESLKMIEEEGPRNVLARHALLAQATRAGVQALGIELFPQFPSEALTVIRAPQGLDMTAVMKTARDRYGVTFADGQGEMKGKVLRIAHMGFCSAMDSLSGICALELALKANGGKVKLGAGVAAAQEVIATAGKDVLL